MFSSLCPTTNSTHFIFQMSWEDINKMEKIHLFLFQHHPLAMHFISYTILISFQASKVKVVVTTSHELVVWNCASVIYAKNTASCYLYTVRRIGIRKLLFEQFFDLTWSLFRKRGLCDCFVITDSLGASVWRILPRSRLVE